MEKVKIKSCKALNFSGFPGSLSPPVAAVGAVSGKQRDNIPQYTGSLPSVRELFLSLLCNFLINGLIDCVHCQSKEEITYQAKSINAKRDIRHSS